MRCQINTKKICLLIIGLSGLVYYLLSDSEYEFIIKQMYTNKRFQDVLPNYLMCISSEMFDER